MKKILVTGGAGYIGCHAVRRLKEAGYSPIVLDNLSMGHRRLVKGTELLVGDLKDPDFLAKVFKNHRIEAVLHFAALALVGESIKKPLAYYTNNTGGSINLLNAMLESGVGRIIFSSSAATYGEPEKIPIGEGHPQHPINPYGASKLFFEKILDDTQRISDLKFVALRYFNVAGAHEDGDIGELHEPETHIVPLAVEAVIKGTEFSVYGDDWPTRDGTCIRDYVHVVDLVDAHILALEHLDKGGKSATYNLGSENGFSVKEVLKAVEDVAGKKMKARMGKRRPGDPAVLIASSEKIKKELGWKPRYDKIEKIIETAYRFHKNESKSK